MRYIVLIAGLFLWVCSHNLQAQKSYLGGSKQINDSIQSLLQQIEYETITVRKNYFDAYRQFGKEADSTKMRLQEAVVVDSVNLLHVKNIYYKYGWPEESQVGGWASQGAFLQIQHADLNTKLEFYSVIKKVAKKGELPKFSYGLLTDAILVSQGKKQLYGSQGGLKTNPDGSTTGVVWPIKGYPNIKKINKRRVQMGFSEIDFNEISYDPKVKPKDLQP